jgi:ribose transport system substrate-binding protein
MEEWEMRKLLLGTALVALLPFAASAADSYKFVVVSKTVHPWFDIVVNGAKAAAKMLHEQTGKDFEIEYLAPQSANVVEQNNLVERAIATQPAGIMIDMNDPAGNEPVLQEAIDQGIPVVVYDNFGRNSTLKVPVVGNNLCQQATDGANELAKLIGEEGEVAVMLGVPTAPTHATRAKCGQDALAKYPKIKIVAQGIDNDSIEQAQQQAATIMQANPNLKGWIAASGAGPIGIGQAIVEAGKTGKVQFIGIDNLTQMVDLVNKGVTPMSLSTDPFKQGYWATIIMWQKKLGQDGPEVFDTGYYRIDPKK